MTHLAVRARALASVLAPVLGLAACRASPPPSIDQGQLLALERRATYVFHGTVVARGVWTSAYIGDRVPTASVVIDQVFAAPTSSGLFPSETVTVALRQTSGLPVGARTLIYAAGWYADDGLGVRELQRFDQVSAADARSFALYAAIARRALEDEQLAARLARAALVVSARVTSVLTIDQGTYPEVRTEHGRMWLALGLQPLAVIAGDSAALRGGLVAMALVSAPAMGPRVRQLEPADSAIFLLSTPTATDSLPPLPAPTALRVYVLADSVGVRPMADSARVRALSRRR